MKLPSRRVIIATVSCYLFCVVSIVCFYSLLSSSLRYPFLTYSDEALAVCVTAAIAILVILPSLLFSGHMRLSFMSTVLRIGICDQLLLTLYAVAGWPAPTTPVNPSTFFSEYNWLTFIFGVAPMTALAAGALSYYLHKGDEEVDRAKP